MDPEALGQRPRVVGEGIGAGHALAGEPGQHPRAAPARLFFERWGATIAIERRPSVAARLHTAERALADSDADVRERAIRERPEIVQAAYHEVAQSGS
jgi:hypothetical protein